MVAARLRAVLDSEIHPSEIRGRYGVLRLWMTLFFCSMCTEGHKNCDRVQDAYTMRCVPQVHGVVHDTNAFVRGILSTEINSATDNPVSFDLEELYVFDFFFLHPRWYFPSEVN